MGNITTNEGYSSFKNKVMALSIKVKESSHMTNKEIWESLNRVTQKTNIDQFPCYENINIKQEENSYLNLHSRMVHAPAKLLKQWEKAKNPKLEFGKGLEKKDISILHPLKHEKGKMEEQTK